MGIVTPKAKPASRALGKARPTFTGRARPKYVEQDLNVYEAALGRIRWLFDEFEGRVTVANSGGKDSTVVLELALMVAREKGHLPLKVTWLDQECEFEATVVYQRYINEREDVDFRWYQVPFRLFNATNHDDPWLRVWGEGEEWVRAKEPDSIHENTFVRKDGTQVDRFKELLSHINAASGGGAILTGMRTEESPARRVTMTTAPMYKWVTWGSEGNHYPGKPDYWMFHPIYDWSYRDVWKAIHDHGWRYNTHYDTQFQYGVPVKNMRVSNYHHETALGALHYLQEAEPQTWEAATRRLAGINAYGHVGKDQMPKALPYMFPTWASYLDHLIANLITDEEHRETFRNMHRRLLLALPEIPPETAAHVMVGAVIGNDLYGTTVDMYSVTHRNPKQRAAWAAQREKEAAS